MLIKEIQSAGVNTNQIPFLANLHITETRSILFLTKCDKNSIIGWAKAHSETVFSVNDRKSSKILRRLKRNSRRTLISGWSELF